MLGLELVIIKIRFTLPLGLGLEVGLWLGEC